APVSLAGGNDGCWEKCPPPYVHCFEGPPRIKFKHACPKPVCGPCEIQHYGYYPTCWRPFPWPPDYTCCPTPQPGHLLPGMPMVGPVLAAGGDVGPGLPPADGTPLPQPRKVFGTPPPGSNYAPVPRGAPPAPQGIKPLSAVMMNAQPVN